MARNMNKSNKSNLKPFLLFELISLFIVSTSFISIISLFLNKFNPVLSLLFGVLVSLTFYFRHPKNFDFKSQKIDKALFTILIVALFLRLHPFPWTLGGQDQGTYTNMSAYYQRYGSNFPIDKLRDSLTPAEKEIYDQKMHFSMDGKNLEHHLSIHFHDLEKSEYNFSFYPLHPIWMAVFGSSFGFDNRFYSLTFFSLLSIVSIYFLTLKISANKKAAYLAAGMIAINPLHTFFSRFPVTEILSVFFSTSAIYFFLQYFESTKSDKKNNLSLLLSIGLFFCLFFNHAGGFLYLPLLFLLFFISAPGLNKKLIPFYIGFLSVFALSNYYGYNFAYYNLGLVYQDVFGRLPIIYSNQSSSNLIFLAFFLLIFTIFYLIKNLRLKIINLLINNYFISISIVLIFILILIKNFQISFTSDYPYEYANKGVESFLYSSFYTFIRYLNPIAFIILLITIFKTKNNYLKFLFAFLFNFFIVRTYFQATTPYQYYYARYLLPELLPYSIIIISVFLAQYLKPKNDFVKFIILIIAAPSLYFTFFQLQGTELKKTHASIKEIASFIKDKDVLIDGVYFLHAKMPVTLSYYYDKNVLMATNYPQTINEFHQSLTTKYHNIYVLYPVLLNDPNLIPVKQIIFYLDQFAWGNKIPTKFETIQAPLYLYKVIDKNAYLEKE